MKTYSGLQNDGWRCGYIAAFIMIHFCVDVPHDQWMEAECPSEVSPGYLEVCKTVVTKEAEIRLKRDENSSDNLAPSTPVSGKQSHVKLETPANSPKTPVTAVPKNKGSHKQVKTVQMPKSAASSSGNESEKKISQ